MIIDSIKKIDFLILNSHRNKFIVLTFLVFFGMLLEVIGLGAIIPVISYLLDPELIKENQFFSDIIYFAGIKNHKDVVFFFLSVLLFIYVFKTIYLVFLNYIQNKFIYNLRSFISSRLFNLYMDNSYDFHLRNNSSILIKNFQTEIPNLGGFLSSILLLFVEGLLFLSVVITLIYIDPVGAIGLGLFFGILSYLFFSFTKNKIRNSGILRENIDTKLSKLSFEGIGGIKEISLLGRINYFKEMFFYNSFENAKILSYSITFTQLGRYFLELVCIIGLSGFIIIMISNNVEMNSIITILTIFTAGAFKMIPSLNRMIASFQNLNFYKPAVDKIYNSFKVSIKNENHEIKKNKIYLMNSINVNNLWYSYDSKSNLILKDVSFKINKGQIIGFIGESGSGKSTLIDLLIGILKPINGEILVDGVNINNNLRSWQDNIGYIPQSIYLTDDSILKNIAIGINESKIDLKAVKKAIKASQLNKFIESLDKGIRTNVGERGVQLSGGQKQRIGIARALYHNPEVLVFDEATSALDDKTEEGIIDSIRFLKRKKTIIVVSHRMSSLKDCDKLFIIKNKSIYLKKSQKNYKHL